jgi:hypothetical protein
LESLGDSALNGEILSEKGKIGAMRCRGLETRMDTGSRGSDVANQLPRQMTVGGFVE